MADYVASPKLGTFGLVPETGFYVTCMVQAMLHKKWIWTDAENSPNGEGWVNPLEPCWVNQHKCDLEVSCHYPTN